MRGIGILGYSQTLPMAFCSKWFLTGPRIIFRVGRIKFMLIIYIKAGCTISLALIENFLNLFYFLKIIAGPHILMLISLLFKQWEKIETSSILNERTFFKTWFIVICFTAIVDYEQVHVWQGSRYQTLVGFLQCKHFTHCTISLTL